MSLIKRNKNVSPFNNLDFLDTNTFSFNDYFLKESHLPPMNIKENSKSYNIEFAVPGFSKKDFNVIITNNVLTVSAEKSNIEEEKRNDLILILLNVP